MKKFIYGLSAALLLASLTACGNPKADQPNEPDPTPSAVQTENPSMEPTETVSAQSTGTPTETVTPDPSPDMEESSEPIATKSPAPATTVQPSVAPVATEPPKPAATVPASVAPVITEPPVSTQPATANNGTSNEHIGEDGMFHGDNYVGEIPGMVYVYPFGYYPEGGNVQIIDGNMPNWNDVVGGD